MKDDERNPIDAQRLEAAAGWLARTQSGDATESDWASFADWLEDPDNKAALARIETPLATIEDNRDYVAAALRRGDRRKPEARKAWGWAPPAILAAGIAFAVFAGVLFTTMARQADTGRVLAWSAPRDALLLVNLPDDSTALLNRGAIISATWSKAERRIVLEQGEVAFNVRHDPAQPFILQVGNDVLHDVGTEFNIQRKAAGFVLTVREGAVGVELPGRERVEVSAGHAMSVDHGRRIAAVSKVEPDNAFAWRDGKLVFHNAPLSSVVADLNRYSETPFAIADAALADVLFSGVLRVGPAESMAQQLEAFLPLRLERRGTDIVLHGR